MINGIKKETIVSTTEDRLTLLQWLKKLEKTLSDDTLTDIAFNDDGGNVSLVLTFEDGTTKSVAFPYDMSEFESKEESKNKVLSYVNLSLSDFDYDETEKQYYLKSHLSDGIYRIALGSKYTFSLKLYGKKNGEIIDLGHHYLLTYSPSNNAGSLPIDGYEDGLGVFEHSDDLTYLPSFSYSDHDMSNDNYIFLIVTNGIVIVTDFYEI